MRARIAGDLANYGTVPKTMGVASAINDLLRSVAQQQRVSLSHFQDFLQVAPTPVDLDQDVQSAQAAGQIHLLETVSLDIAGKLENFRFPLPRGEAPETTEV